MGFSGIVRRVDKIGRIVIPKEMRNNLNIKEGDPVEIIISEDAVMLKKFEAGCKFCGNKNDIVKHMDYYICKKCINVVSGK